MWLNRLLVGHQQCHEEHEISAGFEKPEEGFIINFWSGRNKFFD